VTTLHAMHDKTCQFFIGNNNHSFRIESLHCRIGELYQVRPATVVGIPDQRVGFDRKNFIDQIIAVGFASVAGGLAIHTTRLNN